jgi:hypothetical protein
MEVPVIKGDIEGLYEIIVGEEREEKRIIVMVGLAGKREGLPCAFNYSREG